MNTIRRFHTTPDGTVLTRLGSRVAVLGDRRQVVRTITASEANALMRGEHESQHVTLAMVGPLDPYDGRGPDEYEAPLPDAPPERKRDAKGRFV